MADTTDKTKDEPKTGTRRDATEAETSPHTQQHHTAEARKHAQGPGKENIETMNIGSPVNPGAPVIISRGLHPHFASDPVALDHAQRLAPPGDMVPAQDPTPIEGYPQGVAGRVDHLPAYGGPAAVRRVDDRTPSHVYDEAQRPYNDDPSARRVGLTGRDAAEEGAEGKRDSYAEDAREAAQRKREAEETAIKASHERGKQMAEARKGNG